MMLSLFGSVIKDLFALITKNSHNNQLYSSMATKKKHIRAKRYPCTRMTFSHSLMVPGGVLKFDYTGLILLSPGVKKMAPVILACFRHNIRQVFGKFRNGASLLTLIFHKVV